MDPGVAQIEPGDMTSSDDGGWTPVIGVRETGEMEDVYTLRVSKHATFFVGGPDWGFSVWVHNSCNVTTYDDLVAGDASAAESFQDNYLNGSGGRWGGAETRALNDEVATQLRDGQGINVTNGAGRGSEEWIPGPNGGTKGGTWVDITGVAQDGSVTRVQTIDTLPDGVTPTPAEAAAANRIRAAFPNDQLLLIPKSK